MVTQGIGKARKESEKKRGRKKRGRNRKEKKIKITFSLRDSNMSF